MEYLGILGKKEIIINGENFNKKNLKAIKTNLNINDFFILRTIPV